MRFGTQQQSLNISLTSIGLLWNIIDFLCHDLNEKIKQNRIQNLWLCLYSSIGQLCVDGRPEIRKSAGQTLFGTQFNLCWRFIKRMYDSATKKTNDD